MGNLFCPVEEVAHLSSIARDICPFPNYSPNPLFSKLLSTDSSLHLRNHYTAVQSSLTPKQLEDFTQSLKTTFGKEGKVTLGGVGVVALSLAVLFDTISREVRGEWVPESGPIPGLFVKDLRGYYPPQVYTISEYLRLVPHIANNPSRMKKETERYLKQLKSDDESLEKLGENHTLPLMEDITIFNMELSHVFALNLQIHHLRIKNATDKELDIPKERADEYLVINFNCNPKVANKVFLAEIEKSDNYTKEALRKHILNKSYISDMPLLYMVAREGLLNAMYHFTSCKLQDSDARIAQRKDFDLKANALGKWEE